MFSLLVSHCDNGISKVYIIFFKRNEKKSFQILVITSLNSKLHWLIILNTWRQSETLKSLNFHFLIDIGQLVEQNPLTIFFLFLFIVILKNLGLIYTQGLFVWRKKREGKKREEKCGEKMFSMFGWRENEEKDKGKSGGAEVFSSGLQKIFPPFPRCLLFFFFKEPTLLTSFSFLFLILL